MKLLRISLFSLLFFCSSIIATNQWSLLIYLDPYSQVTEAVIKNIYELAQGYASENVCAYVQLRLYLDQDPERSYASRFIVKNNSLQFVETVTMTDDPVLDVTNAIDWAFSQQPSQYYGILFGGHGSGILEQHFNQENNEWEYEYDAAQCVNGCAIKRQHHKAVHHRSIMLNDISETCINNNSMIEIMNYGSQFLQQKIDFVSFDLCMASCIEHAYQLAPYVHYMVGCQNCALFDGFDFYALGQALQQENCSPRTLCENLVKSFGTYYQNVAPDDRYTLSAFDLHYANDLTQSVDKLGDVLVDLVEKNSALFIPIMQARQDSFHACIAPMYTDLYQITDLINEYIAPSLSEYHQTHLQKLVNNVQVNLKKMVFANITGRNISDVHGCNIYFPYSHVDSSYGKTQFAQNSSWIEFIEIMTDLYELI